MMRVIKTRLVHLVAILLGISLVFAFAPFDIYPLAVLAPAGLLALIMHTSPSRAGRIGFSFGLGMFSAGVYWVFISIHEFGDVPSIVAGLITACLIAILALFPAITCYLTNRYYPENTPTKLTLAFPAIWLISEWLRSLVGCGFPWLFLGYSQTHSPLKGFAPIFSVYGVSLAVLVCSGLLVNMLTQYKHKNYRSLYTSLFGLISIWTIGFLLALIPWTNPTGKPMTVSLVQGNIPQSVKWSPEHIDLSFDRYTQLTEPLWGKSDIIVWPEAAIPMALQESTDFIDALDIKASKSRSHLILGIPIQSTDGKEYYNAVITLGDNKSAYLKRRLVPFGEYIPFQSLASHVFNFLHVPLPNMQSGKRYQTPLQVGNVKINTSICFEITFPELVHMRDSTIGMLLTVTNDAWFGHSIAQAQHLQMAEMRAIELGRPLIFASNDGISAIIGPTGKIEAAAPTHVPFVLTSNVQPTSGVTPWMTNGMDPILVILFCFLFGAKKPYLSKKRAPNGSTIQST
jgi:apolipoprotein N-acyltransferase